MLKEIEPQLLLSFNSETWFRTSAQKYAVWSPAVAVHSREKEADVAPAPRDGTDWSVPKRPVVVVRQLGLSTQKRAFEAAAVLPP